MGINTKKVERAVSEDVVVSVVCDLCGAEGDKSDIDQDNEHPGWLENRFAVAIWTAGYGSDFDGRRFEAVICDRCMKLLSTNSSDRTALQSYVRDLRESKFDDKGGG